LGRGNAHLKTAIVEVMNEVKSRVPNRKIQVALLIGCLGALTLGWIPSRAASEASGLSKDHHRPARVQSGSPGARSSTEPGMIAMNKDARAARPEIDRTAHGPARIALFALG